MNDIERIKKVITSDNSLVSIVTYEEQYVLDTIRQAALDLKMGFWVWSIAGGVREGFLADSLFIADTESPAEGLLYFTNVKENSVCVTLDLAAHLTPGLAIRTLRNLTEQFQKNNNTLIMIDSEDILPGIVKSYAKSFEISYPDETELKNIIRSTLQYIHCKKPIEVGITSNGIAAIIRNLRGLSRRQAERVIIDTVSNDLRFDDNDINTIIAGKRRMIQQGGLLEYIETPLNMNEIGGMKNLKKWLSQRKDTFSAKAIEFGLEAPKGIFMLGVQGAGKSLCAKAIATAWSQPLLKLDPGILYNSYIGQSEHNLRNALQQIEMMSPAILWIDEIEKGFASAASQSTDGGLSKRMFGTLLTWMQERKAPVFVVATANDIEALPPELLRKGRFDEIFFIDLPKFAVRKEIFKIHLQKRKRDPLKFDLDSLAGACAGFSGSEIEQAVLSALQNAYADKKNLSTEIILNAIKSSPPLSITLAEQVEYLRKWAQGRCVPAD
jgi:hypothetical protein